MENTKNYVIVLEPARAAQEKIENFRLENIGQRLVDNLPPHITFKMRFALRESVNEADIIDLMNDFDFPRQIMTLDKVEKFGDALVLVPNDSELGEWHKAFCRLIDISVSSFKTEMEGKNFKPHMTLYRDGKTEGRDVNFALGEVAIERMSFYEIDSTPERGFANLIFSREL
jgi:2'-5' RNA ligase